MGTATEFDFDFAVFCYFMKHGKAATVSDIAKYASVSESRVRKVVSSNKYDCSTVPVDRPVRERNYGSIRCHRQVTAFQPSVLQMREKLIDIRHEVNPWAGS